jgi:hypothetical protein
MSIIVVYHKGCMDGFGAALVAGDGITVVDALIVKRTVQRAERRTAAE